MRLERFAVEGYKNFQQKVVMEDMVPVCVIHGENNVGKSNLLKAQFLFLQITPFLVRKSTVRTSEKLSDIENDLNNYLKTLEKYLFPINDTSNRNISLSGHFEGEKIEFNVIGMYKPSSRIEIKEKTNLSEEKLLNVIDPLQRQLTHLKVLLIGVDRRISQEEVESTRSIIPHSLMLQLYDLKDDLDPESYQRWLLFVKTMKKFNDILGDDEGEFISIFDRNNNRANLVYQSTTYRTPVELLGSGIQQLIALVARLLVSDANIVLIEEPELNLRYTLQQRLREVFIDITANRVGPNQIIFSSHSPAFETGDYFYGMKATPEGPIIERHPVAEAVRYTHNLANAPPTNGSAPISYVTSDGLLRLTERMRKRLGVENGGGVVLTESHETGHIEVLSNDEFWNELGDDGR
jgi:AAA15 family ATPase/GTPase